MVKNVMMFKDVTVHRVTLTDRELESFIEQAYFNGSELVSLQQLSIDDTDKNDETFYNFLIVMKVL